MEKFVDIVGFEDYQISNHGRVFSKKKNKILSTSHDDIGYVGVRFGINGRVIRRRVHRLVAEAFIPNPNPFKLIEVNHMDRNKDNNHVDNLEWVTRKENLQHSHSKIVQMLDKNGILVREFKSTVEAALYVGGHTSAISKVCKGTQLTHKGKKWRYKE